MRALLASLLLLTALIAGCSDGGGDGGDADGTTSASGSGSGSSTRTSSSTKTQSGSTSSTTATGTGSQNRAPTGSLQVEPLLGTAPLAVNFTLAGSDADGDALSWTLAFGDGNQTQGTSLPANATHSYSRGNFTANFTISDGTATTSYQANITVNAAAGGSAGFVFTGEVSADCATACESCDPAGAACAPLALGPFGCASFNAQEPGVDCVWVEITADLVGRAFTLTSDVGDPDLSFIDVCNVVDGSTTQDSWAAGPEAGVVPAGFECAVLWEYNAIGPGEASTLTFTVA